VRPVLSVRFQRKSKCFTITSKKTSRINDTLHMSTSPFHEEKNQNGWRLLEPGDGVLASALENIAAVHGAVVVDKNKITLLHEDRNLRRLQIRLHSCGFTQFLKL
jgi:hypothetical protein